MSQPPTPKPTPPWTHLLAFAIGAATLLIPWPVPLTAEARRVLAVLAGAIVLWMTEALPLAISSLLALVAMAVVLPGRPAAAGPPGS